MPRYLHLLHNRDVLMVAAIFLGFLSGEGARWTEKMVIPALVIVMTLSTMGVPGGLFRSPRALLGPALAGLAMNYGILSGVLIALNFLLIRETEIWTGFILMAATPPAIGIIPFTFLLNGNGPFSLVATLGCYLGALILAPIITLGFLGAGPFSAAKLVSILIELIVLPLVFSRILLRLGLSEKSARYSGAITNWSFFIISYTIVGLNRGILLERPLSLLPPAGIAVATTFLLGYLIAAACRALRVPPQSAVSLMLLGTQKNTGLAAGLALALFSKQTAVPATVTMIFMIVYILWLSIQRRGSAMGIDNRKDVV